MKTLTLLFISALALAAQTTQPIATTGLVGADVLQAAARDVHGNAIFITTPPPVVNDGPLLIDNSSSFCRIKLSQNGRSNCFVYIGDGRAATPPYTTYVNVLIEIPTGVQFDISDPIAARAMLLLMQIEHPGIGKQ